MKSPAFLRILIVVAGIASTSLVAQVQVAEAGILLSKIERKPGRNSNGDPLWQSAPIADRNYITTGELATTYGFKSDYAVAVPYVMASGRGKIEVALWKSAEQGRRVLNQMEIAVNAPDGPKQCVVNVLYGIAPLREEGGYGVTFKNNGTVIQEATFFIGEPAGAAAPAQATPHWAVCRTCGGTGVAENTSGKLGPNREMIVTKRERVQCWTCGGSGKVKVD